MGEKFLSVGDIVGFYSPTHANRGHPGDSWRHGIVLGLEIDERKNNKIEGLWLCRLSDRMDKIRNWDFLLNADEIVTNSSSFRTGEWVVRTHHIHLIPAKKEFFGDMLRIYGRIVPDLHKRFARSLNEGQNGSLSSPGYGPRLKLPHTVVKASVVAEHSYPYFDYCSLLTDGLKEIRPLAIPDHEAGLAERENLLQHTENAMQIQKQFQSTVLGQKAQIPALPQDERTEKALNATLVPESP